VTQDEEYKTWWHNEGSGILPLPNEDMEEFAHRMTQIAWSNGAFKERELCAIECEKIALGFTKWPDSFEGATAETKLMRSLGEFVHKPFTEAIRARGQA
jgi:hypothetical protein